MPGLVTENGFKYLVTRGPKILSAGIKLFAASKESCSKDTCRHPECDNVANCFHLTRMDAVHVSKQRNLFYKKISTSASVEGQNARFRECFFPHEMPIVEDQSLVKGVGAIFQASTTCRSYERCSSWTLFNNGCKGKSKSSTPCRNGTESRDEIDLINCYHDSSSVGCYHQRWMQIFCKKIRWWLTRQNSIRPKLTNYLLKSSRASPRRRSQLLWEMAFRIEFSITPLRLHRFDRWQVSR